MKMKFQLALIATAAGLALAMSAKATITSATSSAYLSADEPIAFGYPYSPGPYNGTLLTIDLLNSNGGFSSTISYDENFDCGGTCDRLIVTVENVTGHAWNGYDIFLGGADYPFPIIPDGVVVDSPASFTPISPAIDPMLTNFSDSQTLDYTFSTPIEPGGSLSFYVAPDALNSNGGSFVLSGNAISDVPEPSTWVMLLAGFGAIGAAMRATRAATPARTVRSLTMLLVEGRELFGPRP
jgi:hypothetical protein